MAVLLHYPRWFIIADQASQATGHESLIENLPALCKWDCGYYHAFAQSSAAPSGAGSRFFPLFGLLLRLTRQAAPSLPLAMLSVIVSNFLSVAAIAAALVLGSALWTKDANPLARAPLLLGMGLSIYPYSEFFSFGYAEPLFLLLLVLTVLGLARKSCVAAAIPCGLLAVTRPQGVWVLALFLACLFALARERKEHARLVGAAALAVGPFAAFSLWQWNSLGSPIAWIRAQAAVRGSGSFLGWFRIHLPHYDQTFFQTAFSIFGGVHFLRKSGVHWKFLGLVTLAMSEGPLLVGGAMSYPRFSAINLGLFVAGAEFAESRDWVVIAFLVYALTRMPIEVRSWFNAKDFMF